MECNLGGLTRKNFKMKTNIIKILNKRVKHFEKTHHSFEAREIKSVIDTIKRLMPPELFSIPVVSNWVAIKNALPNNDNQVFVKYENGKYGINEWWESDNCWKYNFENMIVKEWCKPPCC